MTLAWKKAEPNLSNDYYSSTTTFLLSLPNSSTYEEAIEWDKDLLTHNYPVFQQKNIDISTKQSKCIKLKFMNYK